jgi:tetratricopeptide (TPR) repeat protein
MVLLMLPSVPDWRELATRAESRYRDGERRLPTEPDARQRQLTRMGNAAGAAALSLLMIGEDDDARLWLRRAAERYRESYGDAPPRSWGRPIGAIKACILADDWDAAAAAAHWAIDEGAAQSESPIGRYAAGLALLVLGRWDEARVIADGLRTDERFPASVADALAYVAGDDPLGYTEAIESVLESFETRDDYLEDIPVADTVLVLQALARRRGIEVALTSGLLP